MIMVPTAHIILCLIIVCNCNIIINAIQMQCMDDNNQGVDWFATYKLPKIKHEEKLVQDGVGYVSITSTHSGWSFSKYSINDSNSMIGNTVKPFYSNRDNISYILYNDQPPNTPSKSNKGHTKGVILANVDSGIWLIHSVPHFLPLTTHYTYSETGLIKGQSFLCISLDLKNLNKVGIQLQYNEPQIYAGYVPKIMEAKLIEITKVISGISVTKPPWYNELTITSTKGVKFTSFAKSKQFGKDLYEDWVAPYLQADLFVETWPNGAGRLPSNCSKPFKVYNIKQVSIAATNTSFLNTQDHSKWAVSTNSSWICIGDINRMEHQKFRGGGTVCLNNEKLTQDYRASVASIEKCQNKLN